jgi:hypothetical protein
MAGPGRPDVIRVCGAHRPPRLIRGILAALAVGMAAALASCASTSPAPGQGQSAGPVASGGAGQLPS